MNKISSPHDKLFKTAMSDIRVAREFFENYLPKNVLKYINLDKLELTSKSYIDENLKALESDILYKTQIENKSAYLYLLAEHQSTPDKLMSFRLIKYMVAIWTDVLKKTKIKGLPLIIPMAFYHGREPYTYSKDFRDLITAPRELIEDTLFKPFHLIDTHEIPDEKLREQHWFGITAFFMKHIFAREFLPYLKGVIDILKKLEEENGGNFVITLLNYSLSAGNIPDIGQLVETVTEGLSIPTGDKIMTLAERLIEKGKNEGMQTGFKQGEQSLFTRLLTRKFNQIPARYLEMLKEAEEDKIIQWFENLVSAKTLDEVFN